MNKQNPNNDIIDIIETMNLPYLRISLTPDCNVNCTFCHNEGQKKGKRGEAAQFHCAYLPLEKYEYIAKNYRKYFDKVTFTGGEPTLVTNLSDIVEIFKKYNYYVTITTNAILLNNTLQQKLAKAGVDRINTSLHSTSPEDCKKIFNTKYHQEIIKNIALLNKNFKDTCKINFMAIDGENIPDQLIPMTELSAKNKLKISFLSLISEKEFKELLSDKVIKYLHQNFDLDSIEYSYDKFKVKETHYFKNGAIWEFDDFKTPKYRQNAFNNDICKKCPQRKYCVEGPYALRVSSTGIGKPCLIRVDNHKPMIV